MSSYKHKSGALKGKFHKEQLEKVANCRQTIKHFFFSFGKEEQEQDVKS